MRIVVMLARRLGRPPRARVQQIEPAIAIRLHRMREDDLVLLRGLPGEANADVAAVIVAADRSAQIGLVQQGLRLCELVEIQTFGILLRDTLAERGEEPEPVAADRTAQRARRIAEFLDGAYPLRVEVTRKQCIVDIARFKARADIREGGKS